MAPVRRRDALQERDVQLETQRLVQNSTETFAATGYPCVRKPAVEVTLIGSYGNSEAI